MNKIYIHPIPECPEEEITVFSRLFRLVLKVTSYPFQWTMKTISTNFSASLFLVSSAVMVVMGRREKRLLPRFAYYLTAGGLLGAHFLITSLTVGSFVVRPPPNF